jgi:hypothetical protein
MNLLGNPSARVQPGPTTLAKAMKSESGHFVCSMLWTSCTDDITRAPHVEHAISDVSYLDLSCKALALCARLTGLNTRN